MTAGSPLIVAYLTNHYPSVSHSFIRREIHAVERAGVRVLRFASRGWDDKSPDPGDQAEIGQTRYLLQGGVLPLLMALAGCALTRPMRLLRTVLLATSCSRRGERPWLVHMAYVAQACRLLRWLQRDGVHHVHAHFGTNPTEVALLVHALGGPGFSFTAHGPEEFDKALAIALPRKIDGARFVVGVSSFGKSQLFRYTAGKDWAKIHVVHCGLDAAFHDGHSAAVPDAPQLVCVGRLCEQKGQLLLVQALAQLVREGVAAKLVLAGDGPMRADVEALVDQLGLRSHVSITGWIASAQVREHILAARALVLPSFAEGLPVVLMEAMALGRPVISTYVAGIPELVHDTSVGHLVPAGDVDALARAMRAVVTAPPQQLATMGEAARTRARERHSVDTEALKLVALFKSHAHT